MNSLVNIGIGACLTGMGASALGVNPLSLSFVRLILVGQGLAWMPDLAKKMRTTLMNRVSATTLDTPSKLTPNNDPDELEDKARLEAESTSDNNPLKIRANFVDRQIQEGIKMLNLSKKLCNIEYDMDGEELTPSVEKERGGFKITLPLLFLLTPDDFNPSSPCYHLLKNISNKSVKYLPLFKAFWENRELANQAKRFVIFHELAHVALRHIKTEAYSRAESYRREREADHLAAVVSGAAEGGAYLFDLLSKYAPTPSETHPPDAERASELRSYLERQKNSESDKSSCLIS